jgi:signal peptidase II
VTRLRGLPLALAVAVPAVAADRLTKVWAERRLVAGPCQPGDGGCIHLVGSLRLHLVFNKGAAFTTGTRLGPLFAVVALVMTIVLLRLSATTGDRVKTVLFGLIAGGAVGNLIDRVVRAEAGPLTGAVIDFIDAQWWPVFNVADCAVVCGVVAFVLYSLREPGPEGAGPSPVAPGSGAEAGQATTEQTADQGG